MRRLIAAAGCALAAATVSACDYNDGAAALAMMVCRLAGGEVTGGTYRGITCTHRGGEPVGNAGFRAAAAPPGDRFRVTVRAKVARRPVVRRQGGIGRARGMQHRGTVRIQTGRRARRAVRGFTRGRFRSRLNLRAGGRDGLGTIDGYMAIGFGRRGASCLRVQAYVTDLEGPPLAQLYFRTAGGTGRAARLRVTGQAPIDSSARSVAGTLSAKRGRPRRPARPCRRLLARVQRRA